MGPSLPRKQCEPSGLGIETSAFLSSLEWRNWQTHQAQTLALPRERVSSTLSSSTRFIRKLNRPKGRTPLLAGVHPTGVRCETSGFRCWLACTP